MMPAPDELRGQVSDSGLKDGIAPENLLLFGHGFSIHCRAGRAASGRRRGARGTKRPRGGEALKRVQAGEWPAPSTVIDLYGSWAAALAGRLRRRLNVWAATPVDHTDGLALGRL